MSRKESVESTNISELVDQRKDVIAAGVYNVLRLSQLYPEIQAKYAPIPVEPAQSTPPVQAPLGVKIEFPVDPQAAMPAQSGMSVESQMDIAA